MAMERGLAEARGGCAERPGDGLADWGGGESRLGRLVLLRSEIGFERAD